MIAENEEPKQKLNRLQVQGFEGGIQGVYATKLVMKQWQAVHSDCVPIAS